MSQQPSAQSFGPSSLQTQAFDRAGQLGQGSNALRGLLDFAPQQVSAGQLRETDMSQYENPHTRGVIDTTLADFDHANRLGLNALSGSGPSSAFGGSRQAVAAGQLVGDNTRALGATLAGLRSQGYDNAQRAAMFDIGNRLGADQFNSNQGLAGAQFRAGAASALDANDRANLGLLGDLGATQRETSQQSDPAMQRAMWLATLRGLLGVNASDLIGNTQTANQTSTGRSTQTGMSFGFNWGPFSFGG